MSCLIATFKKQSLKQKNSVLWSALPHAHQRDLRASERAEIASEKAGRSSERAGRPLGDEKGREEERNNREKKYKQNSPRGQHPLQGTLPKKENGKAHEFLSRKLF